MDRLTHLLDFDDLRTVADVAVEKLRNLGDRARELPDFLAKLYEGSDFQGKEGGKRWVHRTPSGKVFLLHEWWKAGFQAPRELEVWFSTGQNFSFLAADMESPSSSFLPLPHESSNGEGLTAIQDLTEWEKMQRAVIGLSAEAYDKDDKRGSQGPRKTRRQLLNSRLNIVAFTPDRDSLLIQLLIYASRDGQLSEGAGAAKNEGWECFNRVFGKRVKSYLRRRFGIGMVEAHSQDILNDSWEYVWRLYVLPNYSRSFYGYVWRVIEGRCKCVFHPESPIMVGINENISQSAQELNAKTEADNDPSTFRTFRESLPDDLRPRQAAVLLGIKGNTFYLLIKKKIIPTKKSGGQIILDEGWQEAAQRWKDKEKDRYSRSDQNKILARFWREQRGISEKSAETQIKRLRSKGFSAREIADKIGLRSIRDIAAKHAVNNS